MRSLLAAIALLAVAGLAASISESEKAGLLTLMRDYPALSDRRYTPAAWNTSFDLACNYLSPEPVFKGWTGVVCDSSNSIVQLSLNGIPLNGPISDGFKRFHSVRILGLYGAGLNGTIPDWLFPLPYLEELYAGINNLHGEIPNLYLTRLKNLSLDHNALSGTVPFIPRALQSLWLTGNNLDLCPMKYISALSDCNLANQTRVSCGVDCASMLDAMKCRHDPVPSSCDDLGPHQPGTKNWLIPAIVVPLLAVSGLLLFLFTKTTLRYKLMHFCGQKNVPGYEHEIVDPSEQYVSLPHDDI